jgi:DNA modification methylase
MPIFQAIAQDKLNICNKTRSNPLPWRGQFSPELIEAFLVEYSSTEDVVLDPFVGSGTVLLECARGGITALGCEINPAAATLARVYQLCNVGVHLRHDLLKILDECLFPILGSGSSLFKTPSLSAEEIKKSLIQKRDTISSYQLLSLYEAYICLLDVFKNELTPHFCKNTLKRLHSIVVNLPFSKKHIEVVLCDARSIPLPDDSIDYVLTSPPYINVFNYHQQYRESTELLGWNLLAVSLAEIGSNRKNRSNRVLTVIQYCLDMSCVFSQLHRLLKGSGRVTFVVGRESNVRKTAFYNGNIIHRIATESAGFMLELKQERVFKNKFGQDIYEDIFHFSKIKDYSSLSTEASARRVARDVIEEAEKRCPQEVQRDFSEALRTLEMVKPSTMLNFRAASKRSLFKTTFMFPSTGGQNERFQTSL